MADTDRASDLFIEHSLRTSMFFPQSRLMVAGNPKVAGTSLRWWLLPLHGVDVETLTAFSLWSESAPYQTVWDTTVDLTYAWRDLSDEAREDALCATDVLTVQPLRHPVTRAFSAWSGKYLNLEPRYQERLPPGFPEQPPTVDSAEQVGQLFTVFVQALAGFVAAEGWTDLDVHFWPQNLLLGRVPVGPTLQLRQESMAEGLSAISQHLQQHGVNAPPPPRINETVVSYQSEYVTEDALRLLVDMYDVDFSTFDYVPEAPSARSTELDLAWLNDIRGRNRRYGVIHREALRARRRSGDLENELAAAQRRERELLTSTSWRMTRPIRWLSRLWRKRA